MTVAHDRPTGTISPFDRLLALIASDPDGVRLGDSQGTLSGREARELIDRWSVAITSAVGTDRAHVGIGIDLPRDRNYLAAIFAAWQCGHYPIPLNDRWPAGHLSDVLAKAGPALVISSRPERALSFPYLGPESVGTVAQAPNELASWARARGSAHIAYVIFTSGSTGGQKGVVISHRAYEAYIGWAREYFAASAANAALLITAELTFDITMGDIAFALAHDVQIHVSPDPRNLFWHAKLIRDRRIDTFYSVPSTIRRLYTWADQRGDIDLSGLRLVVSGGDSFTPDLIDLVKKLSPLAEFHNVYGPTEVTINCVATRIDDLREKILAAGSVIPIGLPFPHLTTVLYAGGGPATDTGELLVAGVQCMDGYFGDRARTEQAFVELNGVRFYRTGDLVFRDPDGYYFLLGRVDDIVKIKGYRINPIEIDRVLADHTGVREVKTIAFRDGEASRQLISFVVPAEPTTGLTAELLARCRAKLPDYMVPEAIVEVEQIPTGSSGKYDVGALKRLWRDRYEAEVR